MAHKPRGLWLYARGLTRLLRIIPRTLARTKVFNVRVDNRQAVPATGRVIIACNHISIADPVFLWGAVRRSAVAIAMAELWSWRMPGVNVLMWSLGHIPVKRGNSASGKRAIERSLNVLEHDGALLIYPEGRCSRDGLLPFKPGVAQISLASNAPILPAAIKGSNGVKPLRSGRLNRKHPVVLRFGTLIYPADFTGPGRVERLLAAVRQQIEELYAAIAMEG